MGRIIPYFAKPGIGRSRSIRLCPAPRVGLYLWSLLPLSRITYFVLSNVATGTSRVNHSGPLCAAFVKEFETAVSRSRKSCQECWKGENHMTLQLVLLAMNAPSIEYTRFQATPMCGCLKSPIPPSSVLSSPPPYQSTIHSAAPLSQNASQAAFNPKLLLNSSFFKTSLVSGSVDDLFKCS